MRAGRLFETDVETAKAALWRQLFGTELSPALVGALCYVDVRERLVELTGGGWVRDEGDRLLASGADPRVVALMVEAATAKGWKAVRIWGDPAFLAEARKQFEAAGIVVAVVEPPPPLHVERDGRSDVPTPHDPEAIVADLRRARIEAERRLAWLSRPLEEPPSLRDARAEERDAEQTSRAALRRRDEASEACDVAERELAEAWLFKRGAARRHLEEAQAAYDRYESDLAARAQAHYVARFKAARLQQAFDKEQARRRADRASEIQRAQSDVALAVESETVARESPDLVRRGIDAVENVARARLQTQAMAPLSDADGPTEQDASTWALR